MRFALLLACCAVGPASATPALPVDESGAALAAVNTLLDAWREADVDKAASVLHADFRELTYHASADGWNFTPVARERLLGAMASLKPGEWDDRLLDPTVHVDGPIAVVWSRYRFRTPYTEDGVFHDAAHCGVETFQLYRFPEGWRIVNFADTHGECG